MTKSMDKAGFNEAMINNFCAEELGKYHEFDDDPVVRKMAEYLMEGPRAYYDDWDDLTQELQSARDNYNELHEEHEALQDAAEKDGVNELREKLAKATETIDQLKEKIRKAQQVLVGE